MDRAVSDLTAALSGIVKEKLAQGKQGNQNLYRHVMNQVEPNLLQLVLDITGYNQSRTAKLLGLSRSTLRTKLDLYFGNKYFPQVSELVYEDSDEE